MRASKASSRKVGRCAQKREWVDKIDPCDYGKPVGIAQYVDPTLTYLVCWAVFGVWPTLFVLYKLLQ